MASSADGDVASNAATWSAGMSVRASSTGPYATPGTTGVPVSGDVNCVMAKVNMRPA